MKKRFFAALCALLLIFLTACGSSGTATAAEIQADSELTQASGSDTATAAEIQTDSGLTQVSDSDTETAAEIQTDSGLTQVSDSDTETTPAIPVDFDLTEMSSDMVYATVYQMMLYPEEYMGKTVRVSGLYFASYYSVTELYYHYCIISDATACCASGLEFVRSDDSYRYPEDYPEDYTEIVVVGTFGSYEELGITYYCLLDATLELAQG